MIYPRPVYDITLDVYILPAVPMYRESGHVYENHLRREIIV